MQFDYGSQFASYEPNAIKIWASTATATSSLTINDLRITTPGVTGKTVFPGASIAVSQASGTVFQEASSAESVGEFRLWQSPEDVKQRHSDALCGSEAERVSGGQFHFAVYYGEHPIVDVFYPAAAA